MKERNYWNVDSGRYFKINFKPLAGEMEVDEVEVDEVEVDEVEVIVESGWLYKIT